MTDARMPASRYFVALDAPLASPRLSGALLALRLYAGLAFMIHGSSKIVAPFGWMGPDAPVPGVLQAFAALAEFGGGLAWILGLLTPLASIGIIATMTVAILTHLGKGDPFVGGFELAAVYWFVALTLFLMGPGRYSLDARIWTRGPRRAATPAARAAATPAR